MNTEQKEQEKVEEDSAIDDLEATVSDLAFHTQAAVLSILTVLKKFKKDHYESEGDELDALLEEIEEGVAEIYELA